MIREQLTNDITTTLDGGINDSVTSLDVASATGFPSEGNFRLLIGSEILLATAISGVTVTVERGAEGTTASSHSTSAPIQLIATAASMRAFLRDRVSNTLALRIFGPDGDIETSSDYINPNSLVISNDYGQMALQSTATGAGNEWQNLLQAIPATPYSYILNFALAGPGSTADFCRAGIAVADGVGTIDSFVSFSVLAFGDTHMNWRVRYWTDLDTLSSAEANADFVMSYKSIWMKVEDDGTDLTFFLSPNGTDWKEVYTETRTDFITPSHIGPAIDNNDNQQAAQMIVKHVGFE